MDIRMRKEKQILIHCMFIGVMRKAFIFMSGVFIIAVIGSILTSIKCELFTCKYNGMQFVVL